MIDSLTIWRYLSFITSTNYAHDIIRAEVHSVFDNILDILPIYETQQLDKYHTIEGNELPREIYASYTTRELEDFGSKKIKPLSNNKQAFDQEFFNDGSNAWVISGEFTESGKPIIACDPHFNSYAPSLLYLVTSRWDKNLLSGGGIPGIPIFIFGTNGKISWGSSALISDTLDIYSYTILDSKYLYLDKWNDLITFTEKIKVKREAEQSYTFGLTNTGPILYDHEDNLSIRWAADEVKDTSFDGFLQLYTATTVRSVRLGLEKVVMPSLNIVYASYEGDIGYQATGIHPLREYLAAGVLQSNLSNNKWTNFIPFEEMPYCINPPKGYIITANNRITTRMYKHINSFSGEFSGDRATRIGFLIQKLLKNKKKINTSDMIDIQLDTFSTTASIIVPVWLKIINNKVAEGIFLNWDFKMNKNSKEAAIFSLWFQKFLGRLLLNKLGDDLNSRIVNSLVYRNAIIKHFTPENEQFYSKLNYNLGILSFEDLLLSSFQEAFIESSSRTWGEIHESHHQHLPLSFKPYFFSFIDISYWFDLKSPASGSESTINAQKFCWNGIFTSIFAAEGRFVSDLGSIKQSRWGISTGQSGNIFSRHYSDQQESFSSGNLEYISSAVKWESRIINT